MEKYANHSKTSIKYSKITLKKRMQLVKEVLQRKVLVSKAAKKLNLKLSTAKLIVKRYKQQGTYFESKAQKVKRQEIQGKTNGRIENENLQLQNNQNILENNNEVNILNMIQGNYYLPYWSYPYIQMGIQLQNMIFYSI